MTEQQRDGENRTDSPVHARTDSPGDADASPARPTEAEARRALRYHVEGRAAAIREKYQRQITAETMLQILDDRDAVRYPTALRFSADVLAPGEFAFPQAIGDEATDGFTLFMHPWFRDKPETWPALIAYHVPSINYGEIISSDEAELFGATLLGLEIDEYYALVCRLADTMPRKADAAP